MKRKSYRKLSLRRWESKSDHVVWKNALLGFITFALSVLLPACGKQDSRSAPTYFIPPTLSNAAVQIQLVTPSPILPTPTITCENDLTFLEDVTVPDGSYYAPGDEIGKVWLVENSGTCNWDSNYRILFLDGDAMGADVEQALFPARSGAEAEIRINFTVPQQPGLTISRWQAYSPEGEPFGILLYISIIVDPNPPPTATLVPIATFTPDRGE